jgi:hypothetical protein
MVSAVAYNIADISGDESILWNSPASAVYSTETKWVDCDDVAGDLELVVPAFGLTRKSVVVTCSPEADAA